MDKSLKEKVSEEMKRRGVKVPRLSKETGIPKDRIYKWYQQGSNPKPEDSITLEKWIIDSQMKRQQNMLNEDEGEYGGEPLAKKASEQWAVIQLLMHEIATLNAKNEGKAFKDSLDEINNKVLLILHAGKEE